jgi:hypothetical protein
MSALACWLGLPESDPTRGAAESFAEQQLDRGDPGTDVGDGNLDSLAVATVGALELDPGESNKPGTS